MSKPLAVSIQQLIENIKTLQPFSSLGLKRILEASLVSSKELSVYSDFNHPIQDGYGRKLIYDGGYFEVMCMSWNPGDMSAIHDHGYTQWGAVKVFGTADHGVYSFKDNVIDIHKRETLLSGDVRPVSHGFIHQMGNITDTPFLSLHIYGCEDRIGGVTDEARCFDLFDQTINYVSGGVFYHLPQDTILHKTYGVRTSADVLLKEVIEQIKRAVLMKSSVLVDRRIDFLNAPGFWRELLKLASEVNQEWLVINEKDNEYLYLVLEELNQNVDIMGQLCFSIAFFKEAQAKKCLIKQSILINL